MKERMITMPTCYNPSLSEEPRNQPIKVNPPLSRESLLSWLESIGRLKAREIDESQDQKIPEDLDEFLELDIPIDEEEEDESID
jgi:Protein of unknown function (DUF3134)